MSEGSSARDAIFRHMFGERPERATPKQVRVEHEELHSIDLGQFDGAHGDFERVGEEVEAKIRETFSRQSQLRLEPGDPVVSDEVIIGHAKQFALEVQAKPPIPAPRIHEMRVSLERYADYVRPYPQCLCVFDWSQQDMCDSAAVVRASFRCGRERIDVHCYGENIDIGDVEQRIAKMLDVPTMTEFRKGSKS
jgi:hypothetical protein